MNCRKLRRALARQPVAGLRNDVEVARHLAHCSACSERVATRERLRDLLTATSAPLPAGDLAPRVLAAIAAEERESSHRPWVDRLAPAWRAVPVAAALALAAVGTVAAFERYDVQSAFDEATALELVLGSWLGGGE